MTAVRLRGNDYTERALTVHERHTHGMETIADLATAYGASTEAIRQWLKHAKKHLLPALDDKQGWFELILHDQGSRLDDAKDTDSVAIAKNLATLMGVGSAEELKQHMARLETAKVQLVAQAFDAAIAELPNRRQLRSVFLEQLAIHESG